MRKCPSCVGVSDHVEGVALLQCAQFWFVLMYIFQKKKEVMYNRGQLEMKDDIFHYYYKFLSDFIVLERSDLFCMLIGTFHCSVNSLISDAPTVSLLFRWFYWKSYTDCFLCTCFWRWPRIYCCKIGWLIFRCVFFINWSLEV